MKGQLLELIEDLVHQRNILVLVLVKQTQNLAWAYIIMLILVFCLLMENRYLNLKPTIKTLTFQTQLYLGSISNGLSFTEFKEVSLNENEYDF